MNKTQNQVLKIALCALFAALSAALSWLSIPIGPVPVAFTHVSVFLAVGLLGTKYGTLSQVVFVSLGAAGLPVFTSFRGGIGTLLGPTGGFIVGYIGCALVTGLVIDRFGKQVKITVPAMYLGWLVTYACGVPWFMYVTSTGFRAALGMCVVPFLPGDLAKTVLSAILLKGGAIANVFRRIYDPQ